MTFRPLRARDDWHGLLAVLGLLGLDLLLIRFITGRSIDGLTYVLSLWVLASLLAIAYLASSARLPCDTAWIAMPSP